LSRPPGCFACGTQQGFRIYNCDPFRETFRRDFPSGGIGSVEMLFRCNLLALVGGGRPPCWPETKVMVWDDHQNRCIGELNFRSKVIAVKMRRDRIVVVLANKVYLYNFADLKLVDHIETTTNPHGLCAICPSATNTVLACPGLTRGHVRLELYDRSKTTIIPAHEADLAAIALTLSGSRIATASDRGTLIRVFDTDRGIQLQELRRGADRATIYCIALSRSARWLATTSDKGTCHVFKLNDAVVVGAELAEDAESSLGASGGDRGAAGGGGGGGGGSMAGGGGALAKASTENSRSSLAFMRGLLPKYFSSEWSFAQFRVPEGRSICAFGSDEHTLMSASNVARCCVGFSAPARPPAPPRSSVPRSPARSPSPPPPPPPTHASPSTPPPTSLARSLPLPSAAVSEDGSFRTTNFAAGGECEKTSYAVFMSSTELGAAGGGAARPRP
jgi:uncharacterized membrane protein YgcG